MSLFVNTLRTPADKTKVTFPMKPSLPWLRTRSLALASRAGAMPGRDPDWADGGGHRLRRRHGARSIPRCLAYLDDVNAKGGVGGQKIELLTLGTRGNR